jgi:hypothetical protein
VRERIAAFAHELTGFPFKALSPYDPGVLLAVKLKDES